ncbi:ComEA family DNA-binding protein [Nocardia nova]|nr:helix-hairpin-helix domain-containing protein [Nocardia nova]
MTSPEERLCSRAWRLRNSAWVLWGILSIGLLTFVGFLIIGTRARSKTWLVSAAGWGVYGIGMMIAMSNIDTGTKQHPVHSTANSILSVVMFIGWAGAIVHTLYINRPYLKWKAHQTTTPWYGAPTTPRPATHPASTGTGLTPEVDATLRGYPTNGPSAPAAWSPTPANPAWQPQPPTAHQPWTPLTNTLSSVPTYPQPTAAAATGPVDINSAGLHDLQQLGLDPAAAQAVLTTRARLGRFTAPDQIMTEAAIPPHVYLSIKDRLTTAASPTPSSPTSPGRKLEF